LVVLIDENARLDFGSRVLWLASSRLTISFPDFGLFFLLIYPHQRRRPLIGQMPCLDEISSYSVSSKLSFALTGPLLLEAHEHMTVSQIHHSSLLLSHQRTPMVGSKSILGEST
jgi:hypothetical protein